MASLPTIGGSVLLKMEKKWCGICTTFVLWLGFSGMYGKTWNAGTAETVGTSGIWELEAAIQKLGVCASMTATLSHWILSNC